MTGAGYISELGYTHGFYGELAPAHLRLAMLARGIRHAVPDDPTYLELGFGQGLTLNILAATNQGRFLGTDFNPAHAANAAELALLSGAPLTVLNDAFDDLARRTDLPRCDIIALHGIWSWVSDANRRIIIDLARRQLRPGGLLYISYNVTPGWSAAMPLRHVMVEYAKAEARGDLAHKIDRSLDFVQQLVDGGAAYFANNPAVAERLRQLHGQDRHYLAHEFFNEDWDPMPFSTVSMMLRGAELGFAASAGLIEHIDPLHFTSQAQALIDGLSDDRMRETTRDYFLNRQFRRDIFVKGIRTLRPAERDAAIRDTAFVLTRHRDRCSAAAPGALGEVQILPELFGPLIERLDAADGPVSVAGLHADTALSGFALGQVWEALLILANSGCVAPANGGVDAMVRERAQRLNRALCRRAATSGDIQHLAAPETGSAIGLDRIGQIFLDALPTGADPVTHGWSCLQAQGESLLVDGVLLEGEEANLARLRALYATFEAESLPVLRRVGAIPA